MTAPEDCALRTSERALVKTPPGGEKPGNDAFWFPANVLARAGSAVTASNRSAEPAIISRPIQADERGGVIKCGCAERGRRLKPAFHCGRNAGFSRQHRTHFQSHSKRGIIIFADSKLVVFSRKHNETARPDLQVTFGRVCLSGCAGEFFPRLEDDARTEVKPDAGVGNPGLRGQFPPFLEPPPAAYGDQCVVAHRGRQAG